MSALRARLSRVRHALPELVGRAVPAATATAAAAACCKAERAGLATTAGYFHADDAAPAEVAAACLDLAERLVTSRLKTQLAIKSNALAHDRGLIGAIASSGVPLVFDAMAPVHADAILALAEDHGAGAALPARWRRSRADALRLRDTPCRVRLVKGEWADPASDEADIAAAYLGLVQGLAGRSSPVAVATHDRDLAEAALTALVATGTPCELEQLCGLPSRRTRAVAARLGVRVRLYLPFGPGWWPYAVNQMLAHPYLPAWALRDRFGQ